MLLETSAKPIRIRIVSGGEEHSSLESLRSNFSLKDILPTVNDGRLAKWLRQKGENVFADNVLSFHFQSDISNPDKEEILKFIYILFPMCSNKSLEQIMEVWCREAERNFFFLVTFLKDFTPLDFLIECYKEDSKRMSNNKNKWRSIFMNTMMNIQSQVFVGKFQGIRDLEVLDEEDWERVFSDRLDFKNGVVYYQLWKVLSDKPKYKSLSYKYLSRSAKLGCYDAEKQVRIEGCIKFLDKYISNNGDLCFNDKEENEIVAFLKILDRNIENEYCVSESEKRGLGKLSKYCDVVNIFWNSRFIKGFKSDRVVKELESLGERYPDFSALKIIINDCYKNTYIHEFSKSFDSLSYRQYGIYVVKLIKEFEF